MVPGTGSFLLPLLLGVLAEAANIKSLLVVELSVWYIITIGSLLEANKWDATSNFLTVSWLDYPTPAVGLHCSHPDFRVGSKD